MLSLLFHQPIPLFYILYYTGVDNKFTVHTVGAGSSSLAVTVDGPSKAKLDAKEIQDGYEFRYNPSAPGTYYVTIKYAGNHHIAGSPFKVKCTGKVLL